MREYKTEITLTNNSRGIWTLDPTIGCNSGMENTEKGCYGDCYAARYSKKYGYDFSKTVLTSFLFPLLLRLAINLLPPLFSTVLIKVFLIFYSLEFGFLLLDF